MYHYRGRYVDRHQCDCCYDALYLGLDCVMVRCRLIGGAMIGQASSGTM